MDRRMTLEQFLKETDSPERSLAVINRTEPEPLQVQLEKLFEDQGISVSEGVSDQHEEDTVVLLEEGNVVASSPLKELEDAILLVNSDLFKSGTRTLERTTVPDVLDGLAGTRFSLRGYPESDSEKLLLIVISRHIEKQAFEEGAGTLRTSFQRLSRLEDEQGTRRVYKRIAETSTEVHLYGRPDWYPSPEFPVVVHGGFTDEFRSAWFVVYTPPKDSDQDPAALLAIELEARRWDGFWTYDGEFVTELNAYIESNL